jgi:hypothetical protein
MYLITADASISCWPTPYRAGVTGWVTGSALRFVTPVVGVRLLQRIGPASARPVGAARRTARFDSGSSSWLHQGLEHQDCQPAAASDPYIARRWADVVLKPNSAFADSNDMPCTDSNQRSSSSRTADAVSTCP